MTELPPVVSWELTMVRVLMALPDTLAWLPGLVMLRASTFQVRLIDPATAGGSGAAAGATGAV